MANHPALPDATTLASDRSATITIEAPTVEQALEQLSRQLGPEAKIIRADRVRRGGVAGFFTREVVEIEAENPAAPRGVGATFDRLLEAAEKADASDAAMRAPERQQAAQRSLAPAPSVRPTLTAPAPSFEPDLRPGRAPLVTVDWDSARMLELGLPGALVQAIASLDPSDDLGHIAALTEALAPICGSLPSGPVNLIGERADRLRNAVDIVEHPAGAVHLVVDDELPTALPGVPAIVSWTSDRGAMRAISLALGTGARLGFGMRSDFGAPAHRISALDAALAIRELMDRT